MLRDPKLYLSEVLNALDYLLVVVSSSTLEQYQANYTQRLDVERTFIVIGEALAQIAKLYPALLTGLTEPRRVIGFRNLLVHRYWSTDDEPVWSI